jgi:uncharacterized protein YkwD
MVRGRLVAVIAALVLLLGAVSSASAAVLTSSEAALLRAIDAVRQAHGLCRLKLDGRLERAAREHSADMIRRGYFSHGAFVYRVSRVGAHGPVMGENLAWVSGKRPRPNLIVQAWLRSPEHRANLLRPGFRRVGIASIEGTFAGHRAARLITVDFAGR